MKWLCGARCRFMFFFFLPSEDDPVKTRCHLRRCYAFIMGFHGSGTALTNGLTIWGARTTLWTLCVFCDQVIQPLQLDRCQSHSDPHVCPLVFLPTHQLHEKTCCLLRLIALLHNIYPTATWWSMLFTSSVSGWNIVVDWFYYTITTQPTPRPPMWNVIITNVTSPVCQNEQWSEKSGNMPPSVKTQIFNKMKSGISAWDWLFYVRASGGEKVLFTTRAQIKECDSIKKLQI